jgi:radical SAM superfamily enzyme YgiQ (UPF0313 family)
MTGEERYGALAGAGTYLPPLGLAYLAAAVRDRHEVRIVDAEVLGWTERELLDEVARWSPQVVGLTVVTPALPRVLSICRALKAKNPSVITVLGGPYPSACPIETLECEAVDVAVAGEGEQTFLELLDALEGGRALSEIPGLAFRGAAGPVATPPRERIRDLDAVPLPARDLLPIERYRPSPLHYRAQPALSVVCGRGCPWRCTFCSCAKVFRGKFTVRTPAGVAAEVRHLVDRYGAREILFWDDTFGLTREWTLELCDLLRPIGVGWSAWMRVDLVEPDVLAHMAQSGCWHVSYGVESGNQAVLDGIRKGFRVEDVKRAFRWTREAGIEARGTFILGLPGDTWDTMMETVELAVDAGADYAQFQYLTPYPGTELWDDLARHGERLTSDPARHTIWFPVFVPRGITEEQLRAAHRHAHRRFYLRPRYVLDRLLRLRSMADVGRHVRGAMSVLGYVRS